MKPRKNLWGKSDIQYDQREAEYRELNCKVMEELKTEEFKALYLLKLQNYLSLLDEVERKLNEASPRGRALKRPPDVLPASRCGRLIKHRKYMPDELENALSDVEMLRKILAD